MNSNTQKAIDRLSASSATCVLCNHESVIISEEKGIKPLMKLLSSRTDCNGYSAADKIVGKAAAMLYVLLGVSEVYAQVMSESAQYTLARHGILPFCDTSVKQIINRTGSGICPMEATVENINDPEDAFAALKTRITAM